MYSTVYQLRLERAEKMIVAKDGILMQSVATIVSELESHVKLAQ